MSGRTSAVAGRKAVSGQVITLIITLTIAIAALVLLIAFTKGAMPAVTQIMAGVIAGIKETVCDKIAFGLLC